MEIAVALVGLVGAVVGLVAACVPRREQVVHRHEAHTPAAHHSAVRPGRLVARSTLFGLSIGLFFGVLLAGILLAAQGKVQSRFGIREEVVVGVAMGGLLMLGLAGTVVGVRVGLRIATLAAGDRDRAGEAAGPPPQPAGSSPPARNGVGGHTPR